MHINKTTFVSSIFGALAALCTTAQPVDWRSCGVGPWAGWEHDGHADYKFEVTDEAIIETSNANRRAVIRRAEPLVAPYRFECSVQNANGDDDRIGIMFAYVSDEEHYRISLDERSSKGGGTPDVDVHGLTLVRKTPTEEQVLKSWPNAKWERNRPVKFVVEHDEEEIRLEVSTGAETIRTTISLPPVDFDRYRVAVWNLSQPMKVTKLDVMPLGAGLTVQSAKPRGLKGTAVFAGSDGKTGRVLLLASRRPDGVDPDRLAELPPLEDKAIVQWTDPLAHNLLLVNEVAGQSERCEFNTNTFEPLLTYIEHITGIEVDPADLDLSGELRSWLFQAARWSEADAEWKVTPCERIRPAAE